MSSDMIIDDHFLVDINAMSKEIAVKFIDSEEFHLIEGCYQVLGYLKDKQFMENSTLSKKDI